MSRTLLPGRPYPLGSTVSRRGTNFALFSQDATRVDLCLYDEQGKQTECITLRERTAFVWHGFVNGIKAGQLYNYRVDGPWDPAQGHRFNFNKSLVDPYAKAIAGEVDWKAPIFPYDVVSGDPLKMDTQDDAEGVPKSVVVDDHFDWATTASRKRRSPIPCCTKCMSKDSAC
jgi:glycogen operon protein